MMMFDLKVKIECLQKNKRAEISYVLQYVSAILLMKPRKSLERSFSYSP